MIFHLNFRFFQNPFQISKLFFSMKKYRNRLRFFFLARYGYILCDKTVHSAAGPVSQAVACFSKSYHIAPHFVVIISKSVGRFWGPCPHFPKTKFVGQKCWIDLGFFSNERYRSIVYGKTLKTDPGRVWVLQISFYFFS